MWPWAESTHNKWKSRANFNYLQTTDQLIRSGFVIDLPI